MTYLILCVMSGVMTVFSVRFAIWLSHKYNWYDQPAGRNQHRHPVPVLGGLGIIMGIIISYSVVADAGLTPLNAGLLGAIAMFAIGVWDDKFPLNPYLKLSLQMVVVTVMFMCGIRIEFINWPGSLPTTFLNTGAGFVATQVWMLLIINVFNIIDGIDGLSAGVSCLTAMALFGVSIGVSPIAITYLLCTIIGATAVFLRYNFHPAKIFLGDSGSLLLGYLFGMISILGVLKSTISVVMVLFIFAIPLMDMVLSVLRRLRRGKNIFYPDLEHVHHQLVKCGLSVPKTVMVLYVLTIGFGLLGIFGAQTSTYGRLIVGGIAFIACVSFFWYLQESKYDVTRHDSSQSWHSDHQ
jgi:UDP-GlcNAc:undecaprenyl-phosphate GlcNAc-1-phosphate transferase